MSNSGSDSPGDVHLEKGVFYNDLRRKGRKYILAKKRFAGNNLRVLKPLFDRYGSQLDDDDQQTLLQSFEKFEKNVKAKMFSRVSRGEKFKDDDEREQKETEGLNFQFNDDLARKKLIDLFRKTPDHFAEHIDLDSLYNLLEIVCRGLQRQDVSKAKFISNLKHTKNTWDMFDFYSQLTKVLTEPQQLTVEMCVGEMVADKEVWELKGNEFKLKVDHDKVKYKAYQDAFNSVRTLFEPQKNGSDQTLNESDQTLNESDQTLNESDQTCRNKKKRRMTPDPSQRKRTNESDQTQTESDGDEVQKLLSTKNQLQSEVDALQSEVDAFQSEVQDVDQQHADLKNLVDTFQPVTVAKPLGETPECPPGCELRETKASAHYPLQPGQAFHHYQVGNRHYQHEVTLSNGAPVRNFRQVPTTDFGPVSIADVSHGPFVWWSVGGKTPLYLVKRKDLE